jgi:hypothetical protein
MIWRRRIDTGGDKGPLRVNARAKDGMRVTPRPRVVISRYMT